MAKKKAGWVRPPWFKMLTIQWEMLNIISDEDLGAGLKAALRYLDTGDDESFADLPQGALMAFTYMKPMLDDAVAKYNKAIQDGIKGANERWSKHGKGKRPTKGYREPIKPYRNPIGTLSNPIGYDTEDRREMIDDKMIDDYDEDDNYYDDHDGNSTPSQCLKNSVCSNSDDEHTYDDIDYNGVTSSSPNEPSCKSKTSVCSNSSGYDNAPDKQSYVNTQGFDTLDMGTSQIRPIINIPPSIDEVKSVMRELATKREITDIDIDKQAQKFIDYNNGTGWMVGNAKMHDWRPFLGKFLDRYVENKERNAKRCDNADDHCGMSETERILHEMRYVR